jgi:2-desacetyl-2-hydroxyethyl bacteriochlorophyllide A dehydrogenase
VRRAGICGTDLHAFEGIQPFFNYPRILGHELGVEVVEVGENNLGLAAGDRCALEPYFNCGHCIACRRGKSNCCVNLQVFGVHIDGGMREQVAVPVSKLHRSEELSVDQLALVEPLSIGAHAVRRGSPEYGETILVIGVGPIGLSVVQFVRQLEVEVVVMDVSERRLDFCWNALQIEHRIDAKSDPLPQLQKLLGGDLPTMVFDCTGDRQSMQNAFRYVGHGGKLIFVGLFLGDVTFNDPDFHRRESSLLSSRNATGEDFQRVMRGMEAGKIDVKRWITHRVCSANLVDVFPEWLKARSNVLKAVVEW